MTQDDETSDLESTVSAPPNTRRIGSALGGAYFVDGDLVDRYEALKALLMKVRDDISLGRTGSESAMRSLAVIEGELKHLRAELDKRKILVSAFRVYSQTTEQSFPLSDERLVIITGDNVIVRGWDGPGLKCVVEKIILAKQEPGASEFDAIQVDHKLTVAEDKVGLTREQRDQQERDFLASQDGRKLTDEQRAKVVDEIHRRYEDYLAFQGREANTIQLRGFTHHEGSRNVTVRIKSPGGGVLTSSQWQRHATMTVFVPACKAIAVRGCLAGLDIQGIEGDLVLTAHDSKDREYTGSFKVRDVKGNVTVNQVPVRLLSGVTGNVQFTATDEFVNGRINHKSGARAFSTYGAHTTQIDHIGGDLQATFLRTDLQLASIKGTLDVLNQYGTTQLTVDTADSERAHRVISSSGKISLLGPKWVLATTPIYAFTECGRLHTNLSQEVLDDVNFSTGRPQKGWHGFVTPSESRFDFAGYERPAAALENRTRAAGLDLISHAGMVSILTVEETE